MDGDSMQLAITTHSGKCINVTAGSHETVEEVRPQIAARIEDLEHAKVELLCGSRTLADGDVIAHLTLFYLTAAQIKQFAAGMIGPVLNGKDKYYGGCLAANGKIYVAPCEASQVLWYRS